MNFPLHIVTLEDLIILKQCANRDQDKIDVNNIYARFKEKLDHKYIGKWLNKLGIEQR